MSTGLRHLVRSALLVAALAAPAIAQTTRLGNGTAAAPALTFNNSLTSGLYRFGADTLAWSTAGTGRMRLSATGLHPITDNSIALGTSLLQWSDVRAVNTSLTGTLTLTGATVAGAPTWSSLQTFAAGQRVDSATGAARAQILTTARTINGVSFDGSANIAITSSPTYPLAASDGTAAAPSYAFANSTNLGFYRFNADTLGIASAGAHSFAIMGGANPKLIGGAGSMTIQAGTGASRQLTFAVTTSGSAVKNSLILASDSSAQFLGQVRASNGTAGTPTFAFANSANTGFYRFGPDTIGATIAGSNALMVPSISKIVGGAGSMTILAGTGASRSLTLQTTTGSSVVKNTLVLGADTSATFLGKIKVADSVLVNAAKGAFFNDGTDTYVANQASATSLILMSQTGSATAPIRFNVSAGDAAQINKGGQFKFAVQSASRTAATPGISFFTDTTTGFYYTGTAAGTDTIWTSIGGTAALAVPAVGKLMGAATSLTILAGTGNDRTMTLQSSNNVGTATTFATGAGDTLKLPSHAIFSGLTAASGTPNSVCLNSATKQVLENAATSCVVSSIRYKENVVPLSLGAAQKIVTGVKPVTFNYKPSGLCADSVTIVGSTRRVEQIVPCRTGRASIGAIAEQADSIDSRLVSRDNLGRPNSINYEQLTVALLKVAQFQKEQIDSLNKAVLQLQAAVKKAGLTPRSTKKPTLRTATR